MKATLSQEGMMSTFKVGDRVICNGYEGAIRRLETGVLEGMATVALNRGQVTVPLSELMLIKEPKG